MKKQAVMNQEVKSAIGSLKENELRKLSDKPKIIKSVLHLLLGFVTGLFPESYIVSPFAGAAVVSSQNGYALLTYLGACLGYIVSRGFSRSLRYIITLCFILASRTVTQKRFMSLDKTMISAMFAALFTLLSDGLEMLSVRISAAGVLLCFADSLLCACAVYFFSRSFSVPVLKIGIRRISNYDAVCICITAACLLCCVGEINILGFYIFHIPACLLIIFCAYYGKAAGGCISGVLLGLILSFGCETPALFYMYAAGGLAAGVFSFMGQYAGAAIFAVSACASAFIAETDITLIPALIECITATVIFMLLPSKWLSRAEEYLTKSGFKNDNEINMQVALSLKDAAKTVDSISDIVSEISRKMDNVVSPEISRTFARIQHNVCKDCSFKGICWNESFDSTVRDIQQIAKLRLNSQKVRPENLSGGLAGRCQKIRKLSDAIDRDYRQYVTSMDSRLKIDEMRNVVSDQFSSMALLLYDISSFLIDEKVYDENKSRAVKRALREKCINAESAAYRENSFSRATVEIVIRDEPDRINCEKIRKIISSELKKKFRDAEVSVEDLSTVLTFRQKSEYETAIGIKQLACSDNAECGDCAQSFDAKEGCTVAVISDGMGTGKRAALDADMTSTIMNRLLSSGFTFRSALRLVNSALMIKSGEESLSTVDALCVNTYNAACTFYKAGAAASYIKHDEKIYTVEKPSLPVGILRKVDCAEEEIRLESDDVILMVSDGVKGESDEWIKETLLCWSTDNMQELATHIADKAKMKNEKKFPDDITVIAVKIKKK